MSRIGNAPIEIPKGLKVKTEGQTIAVEGPKGKLSFDVPEPITFGIENEVITFKRPNDERNVRALHGMARAMTNNMVVGCSVGFKKTLEIIGVGYRAIVKGKNVDLTLGFSHPISYPLPEGVTAEVDKEGKLHLSSADKALLGSVAADIRRYRPPEPYKGKGVRYAGEHIIRKEGKARGKK
ncbi:50S ribosomal protein L6 [Plesiocystis pacifica SIR-1]|uniref:Large ribosomal subunit protein uL6 n=1 Tax=Plesiocystis pacifica SIR-1 TaxID=391625 RepID=A6GCG5_9BACT|nr:50S ribosomal protein L6 [Plesiocystis pacifica]EDM76422.1 50S ribosomal protein L6 [Plesiocystis pacifica SIR-1]